MKQKVVCKQYVNVIYKTTSSKNHTKYHDFLSNNFKDIKVLDKRHIETDRPKTERDRTHVVSFDMLNNV